MASSGTRNCISAATILAGLAGLAWCRSDRCPHCQLQQPDSGGHILEEFAHRVMKSLYISRHDGAMRKMLGAINHGRHGFILKIA